MTQLTFIHISDTHIHRDPAYTGPFVPFGAHEGVEALIEAINTLPYPVDFVLHTGDIMTDPIKAEEYQLAIKMLRKIRYPVYYIPGNHDRTQHVQRLLMQREITTPNSDYDFEVKGVQFACLDSSKHGEHYGQLDQEQLAWLDAICKADDPRPLVVAVHHHPLPLSVLWLDPIVLQNGEAMHQILLQARPRLRGVFYGHIHEHIITVRDGIGYYSVPSSWFQTRSWYGQQEAVNETTREVGYSVVTLAGPDMYVRPVRLRVFA
ncbi:MAG: metallophosphoesterase [Anaerolineae bacterium]|nr:metallophosphoesterase [Anaerolineae bacterium]